MYDLESNVDSLEQAKQQLENYFQSHLNKFRVASVETKQRVYAEAHESILEIIANTQRCIKALDNVTKDIAETEMPLHRRQVMVAQTKKVRDVNEECFHMLNAHRLYVEKLKATVGG